MIRIEHLPADVLDPSPLARAVAAGKLPRELLFVPRRSLEMQPPSDRLDPQARAALARTLESHLAPLAPHVAVLDHARAIAKPGSFCVVTGQQPGLFASPLYSLYKALQSIALARRLSIAWECPVVPIFWNHADDHDVAEVHHAHFVNRNLDVQKLAVAGLASGKQPLSRVVIDAAQAAALSAALAQVLQGASNVERALEIFAPRGGETFASAFTRAMTTLLGAHGLCVVEPDWIRAPMSRELARIVAAEPGAALVAGARALEALGHPVAIDPRTAALVFELRANGRFGLRSGGDGFRFDGEDGSRNATELAAEIVQRPLEWSPGALLRPLVQDAVLPVVAYVGGYGELAYHAQLGPLRDLVDTPRTAFVPRVSCTLVDEPLRTALAKLGTDVETVIRAAGSYASAQADDAPHVLARLREIAATAARALNAERSAFAELDPSLAVQLKKTGEQIRTLVDKLAEKGERVHQNKSGKGKRHERRVNSVLRPRGEPQERALGPLAYVARFGEDWIAELLAEIDPFQLEHLVVHLEGAGGASEGDDA